MEPTAAQIESSIQKERESIIKACSTLTISEQQNQTLADLPTPRLLWVSRTNLPPPPDEPAGCRDLLHYAIVSLDEQKRQDIEIPSARDVPLEWSAYRSEAGARMHGSQESTTERGAYESLSSVSSSDVVLFFIHGGSFL